MILDPTNKKEILFIKRHVNKKWEWRLPGRADHSYPIPGLFCTEHSPQWSVCTENIKWEYPWAELPHLPRIVLAEVKPIQSIAEEDRGQRGSEEEPHDGHGNLVAVTTSYLSVLASLLSVQQCNLFYVLHNSQSVQFSVVHLPSAGSVVEFFTKYWNWSAEADIRKCF